MVKLKFMLVQTHPGGSHLADFIKPQVPHVPGVPGVTIIWPALMATERGASFRNPGGASRWHT